jgi:hypothetical protein
MKRMWLLPCVVVGTGLAVMLRGPQAHRDARTAGQTAYLAHQRRRAEHATELAEARGEIHDFDGAAAVVAQRSNDDRRIRLIALLGAAKSARSIAKKP